MEKLKNKVIDMQNSEAVLLNMAFTILGHI